MASNVVALASVMRVHEAVLVEGEGFSRELFFFFFFFVCLLRTLVSFPAETTALVVSETRNMKIKPLMSTSDCVQGSTRLQ